MTQTLQDIIALLQEHRPGWRPENLVDIEFVAFVAGWMASSSDFNAEHFCLVEGEESLEHALRMKFDEYDRQVRA